MKIAPTLAGSLLGSADGAFVIAEWKDEGHPPGPPHLIAPLHVHHQDDEAWYVLEGVLCVQIDGEEIQIPAGAGVFVPRGAAHTYWNPSQQRTRYLLIMTPRILRLIEAIHALSNRSPAALSAVFAEHDSALL